MEPRIYLRAFELDDYKTTIAWRKDDQITSMLGGGVNYLFQRQTRRNGLKNLFLIGKTLS